MLDYSLLKRQLAALSETSEYEISLLANASALIWDGLDRLNWAGFYLVRDGRLILGPFQGKLACITIELGKGVCGTAAIEDRMVLVDNVHEFPGHIACDAASNSEIVIPIHRFGSVYGVLDIDSPVISRFSKEDRAGLEALVEVIEQWLERDKA